jgi:hypothetical protein
MLPRIGNCVRVGFVESLLILQVSVLLLSDVKLSALRKRPLLFGKITLNRPDNQYHSHNQNCHEEQQIP